MNVITVASRKGGAGKTTLCAHLAAYAQAQGRRALVIDADPQGSLALCNSLRANALPFATAERGIERPLALAQVQGVEWVFIDTAPTMWVVVQEAIRAATLVLIPARPGFLDLAAVRETVKCARERDRPYAVVLNACPVKRGAKEAPAVAQSRAWLDKQGIPVWSGQVSQRAGFVLSLSAGASAGEGAAESLAAAEIARLWSAVERSVEAVNMARGMGATPGPGMTTAQGQAA
jgi:chromosome partitioning protein